MEGVGEFGVKMNTMPKYVVSSTLKNPTWTGTKVVSGDLGDEVRKLKKQAGKDLLLAGSGQLFNALMEMSLIDVYRLMVHPVVLGKGKRLFAQGVDQVPLKLTDTKRFASGIVILELEPAKS